MDSRVKIIDIAVPWDANIESKYREKIDHYKDLAIELSRVWQKRVTIIPIIDGLTYKALKDLFTEAELHPAVLASADILRRVVHTFFYKNIFYKNIEAEICEILRIF